MVVDLLDCTLQEREWLEGCRKANPKAQEKVFKRYYGLVYGICIRYLSSKELAQEVINDCFLKLFHQLESAHYPDYFRRWLRQLAVHTAIDAYRKEKQYQYLTAEAIDDQVVEVGHQETAYDTLNAEQILGLLTQLPDLWRLTFNLYEIEGYAHEEISQLLNIPVSSSRVYLTRAKQRLRELLRQHDSVRTYMPIYYLPSAERPDDPDWAHFRETLRAYEPMGDADAWPRFQRFQGRYQRNKWWQTGRLVVLVVVTLVCKKSQAPDSFRSRLQATGSKSSMAIASTQPKAQGTDVIAQTIATDKRIRYPVESTTIVGDQHQPKLKAGESTSTGFPSFSNPPQPSGLEKPGKQNAFDQSDLTNKPAFRVNESETGLLTGRVSTNSMVPTATTGRDEGVGSSLRKMHVTTGLAGPFRKTNLSYRHYRTNRVVGQASTHNHTTPLPISTERTIFRPTSLSLNHPPAELLISTEGLKRTLNPLMARPFSFSRLQLRLPFGLTSLAIRSPMSQPTRKQVTVGGMMGSQVVYTPSGNPSLGITGGIWTDLRLSRKVAIETGLIVAHAHISQSGNGLVSQDSVNRWELLQQTQRWWTISLPLTVRYTILDTHRFHWWAAIGVSSAATFGEKQVNDYQVSSLRSNPADSSQHVTSSIKQVVEAPSTSVLLQPFGWVTVSSGVRILVLGQHEGWIEPYFSYPTGGLTSHSLRVSQAGIRLKLRFLRFN